MFKINQSRKSHYQTRGANDMSPKTSLLLISMHCLPQYPWSTMDIRNWYKVYVDAKVFVHIIHCRVDLKDWVSSQKVAERIPKSAASSTDFLHPIGEWCYFSICVEIGKGSILWQLQSSKKWGVFHELAQCTNLVLTKAPLDVVETYWVSGKYDITRPNPEFPVWCCGSILQSIATLSNRNGTRHAKYIWWWRSILGAPPKARRSEGPELTLA